MDTTREDLLQKLLKLAYGAENTPELPHVLSPPVVADNLPGRCDISHLPNDVYKSLVDIIDTFEQIKNDRESMALEILDCYRQLNVAFDSTNIVARCKTTADAVRALLHEVNLAVNSRFGFYLGKITAESSLLTKGNTANESVICLAKDDKDIKQAREFFLQHESKLRTMADSASKCPVKMIDYGGDDNPDYQGRGNALAISLSNYDCQRENLGVMIFIRDSNQQPFAAVELNLANTLIRMGTAILNNIIYVEKLNQTYLQHITSLVRAMEAKDSYTSGHSSRVAQMACDLARYIGLDESEIQLLKWAGMLHDIGKIGVRDDVLWKPDKLTDEEFDHIKMHPVKSYEVLEPLEALKNILPAVRHHHEHYDGSGYPDSLAGDNIPLHARILQVADVWDALTSTRSYRKAMPYEKAMDIMRREAGTTMDPDLVNKFNKMITRHLNNEHNHNE